MLQILKRNPKAAVIAALMHVIIIVFLIVGVDWLKQPEQPQVKVDVVQARVVDEAKVAAEVEKLKKAEQQKQATQRKEEKRLADLKKKQAAEKKRLAELEKKRKAEQQRLDKEKKQRLAEEKKRKEAEAKRKAEEKKRKEAEAKRKAEEKKRKEAAEAKRKAEEEAKRKAEAERKRKEAEAQRAREEELLAAMEAERNAGEINRFMGLIEQKVIRNWLRPAGAGNNLQCRVRVRLAPGGNVIGVSILESSGNSSFDRSAEAAVYKAEPLPVPAGNLFERFRDINFVFNPSEGG
jgi:colicin import membrane protein